MNLCQLKTQVYALNSFYERRVHFIYDINNIFTFLIQQKIIIIFSLLSNANLKEKKRKIEKEKENK